MRVFLALCTGLSHAGGDRITVNFYVFLWSHQSGAGCADAEKCETLQATISHISLALVLYGIGLSIYAARRRTELRERFNIAGAPPSSRSLITCGVGHTLCQCIARVLGPRRDMARIGLLDTCRSASVNPIGRVLQVCTRSGLVPEFG